MIGFPELMNVFGGTTLNQTGRVFEVMVITLSIYVLVSLAISNAMNLWNRRILARGGAC